MPRPRTRSLTIYLLKPDFETPARALRDPDALSSHTISSAGSVVCSLHVKGRTVRKPWWAPFFDDGADPHLPTDIFSAGVASVAIVSCGGRAFALTFGQGGRHLLVPGAWEERFGLIVTLNSVPPEKLRSIDKQSFDAISSHTRTQASKEGAFDAFGFDVEQDLLRAATGTPTDTSLGKRLDGMDAVHVTVPLELSGLTTLLEKLYGKFQETSYKTNFPWIDQLAEVRDKILTAKLDGFLIDRLRGSTPTERLWLAVPEIVDWKDIGGFLYDGDEDEVDPHPDLHVSEFLESVEDVAALDIKYLKDSHVNSIASASETVSHSWNTYSCIYAEIDHDGKTFLLSSGKWYSVTKTFVSSVNTSVAALMTGGISLPAYDDASETAYNARVAAADASLALMDRKNIPFGGGRSTIEFCDLFRNDKKMIHVKRYVGSAPLSHLFAQGEVSAELLAMDSSFRTKVRGKLPVSHQALIPTERPRIDEFEVVYAIVSRSTQDIAKSLPFFSRLNLRNRSRSLQSRGFKVSLVKIPVSTSEEESPTE